MDENIHRVYLKNGLKIMKQRIIKSLKIIKIVLS